jgi:dolichol-phosphate mannosyltransferase
VGASVVVPTYNERDRLEELIERIFHAWQSSREPELTGPLEVIVVDDNSPDGTGECADAIAQRRPVRVVHRAGKLGLGTAVIAGFEVARGRIVAVMDADLSHPPQLLPRLMRVLRESDADFVVASRYVRGGSNNDLPVRRLVSRAACRFARQLTPVQDAMSGFFALRADRARSAKAEVKGFKICLELLVRTMPRKVVEVPYTFVGRSAGKSKANFGEASLFVRQVRNLRKFSAQHGSPWPAHFIADARPDADSGQGVLIMPASRSR